MTENQLQSNDDQDDNQLDEGVILDFLDQVKWALGKLSGESEPEGMANDTLAAYLDGHFQQHPVLIGPARGNGRVGATPTGEPGARALGGAAMRRSSKETEA